MDPLRRLEEVFARFPGIGPRQARRFVYYLISRSPSTIRELTTLIEEVKKTSQECDSCHRFFIKKDVMSPSQALTPNPFCSICSDGSRDSSTLMIVARDSDFESIEKSGAYKGMYFILGATVPVLDREPERRIRLLPLIARLKEKDSPIKEVILSLSTTPEGEHTMSVVKDYLKKDLKNNIEDGSLMITILGRGLSTGAELEYVDGETIKGALGNRR